MRKAIAAWIGRRYGIAGEIDATREVLPVERLARGLFFAAIPGSRPQARAGRPAILIVNPFYQAYLGAALATNCEPVFLNATAPRATFPISMRWSANSELLARTVAFYLCSPANPQGAVADAAYIRKALALARRHDFMLFFDECYSEIYTREPPVGALAVALETPERFKNLVVFNSLVQALQPSRHALGLRRRRRRLPGNAGRDPQHGRAHHAGAVQHASAAVWSDEAHVAAIRAAYSAKFDVCDELLAGRFGYARPAGGFFLWLDMSHLGGAEKAALTIWQAGASE